ncbi:hypothetical protein [Solimonas flava]|uniref:hypothetical protein n=1 Tax=Solimonas flava TaxID=415849 RepID=UPI000408708C|nr:hypothetical protein [Solimonas flava]
MRPIAAFVLSMLLCSCAHYATPGGPAPLAELGAAADPAAQPPSPQLPMTLAVVRIQAPGYRSASATALGGGRYSVLPDSEPQTSLDALAQWPLVGTAIALDPALLPASFETLDALRLAAAKRQADVLFFYTVDTRFEADGQSYAAASELPIGKAAPAGARLLSTASGRFVDVRTGYPFGGAEGRAENGDLAPDWKTPAALDARRLDAERQARDALFADAAKTWQQIAARYQ